MATMSSPDSDDPLGLARRLGFHRHTSHRIGPSSSSTTTATNNNNNSSITANNNGGYGHRFNKAVDPLATKHVEENIESFLETFRHKTWTVDTSKGGLLDRRASSDSGDSSTGWTSSQLSTTDEPSTDSPEGGAVGDREGIIAESRRIARWAWRQSHFTGSQETPCSCSYHPPHTYDIEEEYVIIGSANEDPEKEAAAGSVMDETSQQYRVVDVAAMVQSRYVILSGGKAKNGAPIMTFPTRNGASEAMDEDYGKVVTYLCGIMPLHECEGGFVIVIDRRQDGWGAVKSILLKLSAFFPVHIQVVFLLQPKGFFQRAFADFRSKFLKEELEFKVVLCDTPDDMKDYIDASQLTTDVGGELEFDSSEWTEHRSAVEKFSKNTALISTALSAVVKRMEEREFPNDMAGTEALIRICQAERKELLEDIDSACTHGDTLLKCIKGDCERTPLTKLCHSLELERLLVQLDESRTGFGEFWQRYETKLNQCLALRQFEEEFKLVQFSMERRVETVEGSMKELGNSVSQVETLLKEFEKYEEDSQNEIDQLERMRTRGKQLMMDEHYAVDSIRPKCIELQRMCEQYKDLLRQRREMLTKSHDLQDRLDKASKWCHTGLDLLASQNLDKLQTTSGAGQALAAIENFLKTSSQIKLNNPREFRNVFEPIMTADTRATVQQTLKRMEDVQAMCEKRKESLRRVIDPRPKPVQHVNPEPSRHHREVHQGSRSQGRHSSAGDKGQSAPAVSETDGGRRPLVSLEKSARHRPDSNQVPLKSSAHSASQGDVTDLPSPLGQSNSRSASDVSSSSDTHRSSVSSMSMSSFPEAESLQAKRRHVMNELIETEETYVNELNQILQGYYSKMDDRSLQMMVPPALHGQKQVLFGNLKQIYTFHKDVFLQELKNCREEPLKMGKCFVNRKEEFQMYSIYCQNKPKSESLRTLVGDTNPFFKECQQQLGHKLPLGAYLLKPVQRITKYQLLIREMLKWTGDNVELSVTLTEALDTMLSVLAYLNDSMHQVSIVGYTENISDLGRLLMHGSFRISTEHKHERIRDIRIRAMQRHMFLYQRALLLCKKREDHHNNGDHPTYTFKHKLQLSQVGLTEKIKGDKKKFELWLRGREEVYIIQAPDLQTKDVWVAEIKRVLMSQFDHLKASRKVGSLQSVEETVQTSQLSSDSSDYSIENWQSHDPHVTGNRPHTVPIGMDMSSPISPPYNVTQREEEEDEDGGWSSGEFSNTDDEGQPESYIPNIEPSFKERFVSLGDYYIVDPTELPLAEGDEVEVTRVGSNGWWYARHLRTQQEGWVPSTYLEPVSRVNSMYSSSDSLIVLGAHGEVTRARSVSPYARSESPGLETTV